MSTEDEELSLDSMFPEPPRPPTPEPTISTYTREVVEARAPDDWKEIEIMLVGSHPLWGNYLWNAARALASYLDENQDLYYGKNVLELGAGGALPSIVAAKNGARKVVITDYPDDTLVRNIMHNVETNIPATDSHVISVQGYTWGRSVKSLTDALETVPDSTPGFDLAILSDLIFNHSQHDALLTTCELSLQTYTLQSQDSSSKPCVLVFYTHHRPHLAHRDMEFFTKAIKRGWRCEEVLTKTFPPMFPEDPGEESIRSTVHGWRLSRN